MPASLHSRPRNAPTHTAARAPETDAERRARQLDMLREMAELAMTVARDAAAKATAPTPDPDAPDPGLTFARATRAARQAIALEIRVAAGDLPPVRQTRPDPRPDPRRALLRQALHKAAQNQPNRAALRREIEEGIELELADDPEGEIEAAEILAKLAEQLDLPFDASQLPDELLGLRPTRSPDLSRPVTTSHQTDSDPPKPNPFHRRE